MPPPVARRGVPEPERVPDRELVLERVRLLARARVLPNDERPLALLVLPVREERAAELLVLPPREVLPLRLRDAPDLRVEPRDAADRAPDADVRLEPVLVRDREVPLVARPTDDDVRLEPPPVRDRDVPVVDLVPDDVRLEPAPVRDREAPLVDLIRELPPRDAVLRLVVRFDPQSYPARWCPTMSRACATCAASSTCACCAGRCSKIRRGSAGG